MLFQYLILFLHIFSLVVSALIFWKVSLWRPFALALMLDSLAGALYYASILFFSVPGHDWSRARSLLQATIWAFFGTGLLVYRLRHEH